MKKIIFTFILMITSTFAFSQNALYYHIKGTSFRGEIHKMLYGDSYTPKYQSLGKDIDNAIKDYENAAFELDCAESSLDSYLRKITWNKNELARLERGEDAIMNNYYKGRDGEEIRKRIFTDRLEKTIKEQSNEKKIKKLEKKVEQKRKELDEATDKLEKLLTKYEKDNNIEIVPKEKELSPKEQAIEEYNTLAKYINYYTNGFNQGKITFDEYMEKTKPLEEKQKSLYNIIFS